MKNAILAAAAVLALALSAAPSLASDQSGSSTASNCANILANQDGYAHSQVEYCERQ